jgi:hypothetical protein
MTPPPQQRPSSADLPISRNVDDGFEKVSPKDTVPKVTAALKGDER